jgi:O-antigen/teichoic acid export membrane protein
MIATIKIARIFTTDDYGLFSIIIVNAGMLSTVSLLGLRNIVIRTIARDSSKKKSILFSVIIFRSIFVLFVALLFIIIGVYVLEEKSSLFTILIIVFVFSQHLWDIIESVLFGEENMKPSSILNLAFTSLYVLVILITPDKYLTLSLVLMFFIFNHFIKSLALFILSGFFNLIRLKDFKIINLFVILKNLFKESWPYYLLGILTIFTTQLPFLFLKWNSNLEEVAFYSASFKLIQPMQLMIVLLLTAIFPRFSKLYKSDYKKFSAYVVITLNFIVFLGSLMSFILSVFGEEIMLLIFGDKYIETGFLFSILIWYSLLFSIFNFIGTVLGSIDKQKNLMYLSILYTIILTVFLWFGSKHGATGLALAFIVGGFVNMTYHWKYFANKIKLTNLHKIYTPFILFLALLSISISTLYMHLELIYRLLLVISSIVVVWLITRPKKLINELLVVTNSDES